MTSLILSAPTGNCNIVCVCPMASRQVGWVTDNWDSSAAVGYMIAQKQTARPTGVPSKKLTRFEVKVVCVEKHLCRIHKDGCVDVHTHTYAPKSEMETHAFTHCLQSIISRPHRTWRTHLDQWWNKLHTCQDSFFIWLKVEILESVNSIQECHSPQLKCECST